MLSPFIQAAVPQLANQVYLERQENAPVPWAVIEVSETNQGLTIEETHLITLFHGTAIAAWNTGQTIKAALHQLQHDGWTCIHKRTDADSSEQGHWCELEFTVLRCA